MKNKGPSRKIRLRPKIPFQLNFKSGLIIGAMSFWLGGLIVPQLVLKLRLGSEDGKSLYTLGQLYARRADPMRLTNSEAKVISQGFQDWAGAKLERVDYESHRPQLQRLMESRQTEQTQLAKKEGQDYLKKFVRSGGTLSLSGLAYRIITPGSQKKPTLKDWAEVSYRGTLINGKVIDATTETAPKAKLPMNGVIKGWTEGLQLIGEEGEIELVVPSELAYGDAGTSSDVPPGATLVFRIRLFRVLDSGRVNS